MNTELQNKLEAICEEQKAIDFRKNQLKNEAIIHCRKLMETFNFTAEELGYKPSEGCSFRLRRKRVEIKYRTPTGIEWTGKGKMKKEFRDYLISEGLTEEDKDLFLVGKEDSVKPDFSKFDVPSEPDEPMEEEKVSEKKSKK